MMNKEANTAFWQFIKSMNPLASTLKNYTVGELPELMDDPTNNKVAWNVIGASTGTAILALVAKAVAHRMNAKKWDKKSKKIVKEKVDALYPQYLTEHREERSLLKQLEEKLNSKPLSLPKTANGPEVAQKNLTIGDLLRGAWDWTKTNVELTGKGALPMAAAISSALIVPQLAKKRLEDKDEDKLDEEILSKKKELQRLQAELLKTTLQKKANKGTSDGTSDGSSNVQLATAGAGLLGVLLAAMTAGTYKLADSYLTNTDKNEKKVKAALSLAERNLTNIPQRLHLSVDADNKISVKEAVKEALAEDTEKAQLLLENTPLKQLTNNTGVDFDDKITKPEKDALFS